MFAALGPIGTLAADAPSPLALPEIKVAPGFEITRIHSVQRASEGSWVSLASGDRGRLYASDQYGAVYRITLPREADGPVAVDKLGLPIGGAHGLSWINGSLYAAVGQKGICAPGLYRIRDTNADGELDRVELLQALEGDGEHGPHAVIAGPDGHSLYVLAGNATRLPPIERFRVPKLWADDSLLAPLPALMGSETRGVAPGGWICRTDLDGRSWELVSAGFRNAYALAFNRHGELFTFDSDTEFELNLPWYRPTRVFHAVSGADFGWRRGALKAPENSPDIWPSVVSMGLGSPTAVLSAPGARLPQQYRDALWVADWSYGKIFALHLKPAGATFTANREEVVSGTPLPVTAMCVNPADGAIYFTTGGRRLQSALYRLRWTQNVDRSPLPTVSHTSEAHQRRMLETVHGRADPAAVELSWRGLGSHDPFVRRAARTALEHQPLEQWRGRALTESSPRAALAALLALTRIDAATHQAAILKALRHLRGERLDPGLRAEWLRVLALAFARGGNVTEALRAEWAEVLRPLYPTRQHDIDAALFELLVFCEAPEAAALGVAALRSALTRQAQLDFAKSLRVLRTTWTPELRREFFAWLAGTSSWRGGGSFARFLQRLRDDAIEAAPENERADLRRFLATAAKQAEPAASPAAASPAIVREWTTDDLVRLAANDTRRRDSARGRKLFGAAGCFACHTFDGEGGALGPDLTAVARRMSVRELCEAMVEPSREISDQYGTVQIRVRDGRQLSGRIVNLTETGLHLAENLFEPANVVRLTESEVIAIEPSKHSLMPAGLLNTLSDEDVLDLLAFMRAPAKEASRESRE